MSSPPLESIIWSGRPLILRYLVVGVVWGVITAMIVGMISLSWSPAREFLEQNGIQGAILVVSSLVIAHVLWQIVSWSRTRCEVSSMRVRVFTGALFRQIDELRFSEISSIEVRGAFMNSAIVTFHGRADRWLSFGRIAGWRQVTERVDAGMNASRSGAATSA